MKIMLHQKQVYFNANHRTIATDNRTLSTLAEYCEKLVKSDRLPNLHCGGSIESTTTKDGSRSRYSSGIFLSQIPLSQGIKIFFTPSKAELVKWLISRNKPSSRTNKASRSFVVVETISHPFKQGGNLLLTKQKRLSQMLFKFLLLGEKRLTVRIRAKSEAEARQRIQFTSPAICIARFRENTTACSANSLHKTVNSLHETAQNLVQNDNLLITEQKTILHPLALIGYSADVVAKSTAERGNSNNQSVANDSTPLTLKRAFFVRSLRTPKENTTPKIGERPFLSMVGRNGQRLIVGCEPLIAVFHPVTLYRQAWKLAVDSQKSISGVVQMFYKFLFTGSRLRITVYARTLAEAYKRLPLSQSKPVLIARLPVQGGVYA